MNRRGFLGSIIGLAASLSFLAKLETEEWQRVLLPYRMLFKDMRSGFTIQAPGVAEITPHKEGGWTFRAESLHVTRTMTVSRSILLTERGAVIKESDFSHPICMCNGDVLEVKHDILTNVQGISLEELVDLAIRRKA